MLVSRTIPNLVQGVSQQPEVLRLTSQASEQVNGFSSVVEGLKKRPASEHISKISNTSYSGAFIHTINRDANERYIVIIDGSGSVLVYDINGTQKTVTDNTGGNNYFVSANPNDDFRAVTVADYTFIVNKNKTVAYAARSTALELEIKAVSLVEIEEGRNGETYTVSFRGVSRSVVSSSTNIQTIRDQIYADWNANLPTSGLYGSIAVTLEKVGSRGLAFVRYDSSGTYNRPDLVEDNVVTVSDSFGDTGMKITMDKVNLFSDLPTKSVSNHLVEIQGDGGTAYDNYFVQYDTDTNVWVETNEQNIDYKLNHDTLPHGLVRLPDGTFVVSPFDNSTINYTLSGTSYDYIFPIWGSRLVGDETTAPDPSFIGRTLNDIFFHRNRLGFLTDENVVMSRAAEFFEFFPETVTQVLATDPIDVASTHTKVSILKNAISFDEQLLLFSDQTQFILSGGQTLENTNIQINVATEFETDNVIKPVSSGSSVIFGFKKGNFTGFREYYIDADNNTKKADDITGNVPKYIPKNVFKLTYNTNENILVALTSEETNALYVYQTYFNGSQRVQSAWHKWTFGSTSTDDILNIDFIENKLYILNARSDGTYLESIDVSPALTDDGEAYLSCLDRKIDETKVTMSYNSSADETTITLPYTITNTMRLVGKSGANLKAGQNLVLNSQTGTTIVVDGDLTSSNFFIGEEYDFLFVFSQQFLQVADSKGSRISVKEGRLQIRNWEVSFNDTGYFKTRVEPEGRSVSETTFTGTITGTGILGTINLEDGEYKFSVQSENDKLTISLTSDSHLPCNFINASWQGYYVSPSTRI